MTQRPVPAPNLLPFFLGDLILIGFVVAVWKTASPLGVPHLFACVAALAIGALLACWPFVLRHKAALQIDQTASVADAVSQLKSIETLARQVTETTARWQHAQDAADRTANLAKEIADGMMEETARFRDFMAKANDSERRNLALEVDKLKRSQAESMQVIIALLDNVNALHAAAVRSGQENVVAQLTRFRAVCLDLARRVGLNIFVPAAGDSFDDAQHALTEGQKATSGAKIKEVLAPGFNFQGQLFRKCLVILGETKPAKSEPVEPPQPSLL